MGRAIESAILNEIKKLCFARAACLAITAEYIPTAKNMPVREFYEEHGFSVASVDASLQKHYRLDRNSSSLSDCAWIAFNRDP
jgi:predicted enzyme involved in methoxymalonyl-ACP biosynthesis